MPSRARVPFMRFTSRVRSLTRHSRSRLGRLASSSAIVGTRTILQWPRSPRSHPRNPRFSIIAVVEMSQSSWLVGGVVPGIERQPRKKLDPTPERLLALLHRWQDEAIKAGRNITRIALAFEAGRDGFWLARWLEARGVETHVIHPSSVAVSREHRRAKTDRLDTELLKRGFLGW